MKKSRQFLDVKVTYSLPALWKATPKDRKKDLYHSFSIPFALSIILSIVPGVAILFLMKTLFAFLFVAIPSFLYMTVVFTKGFANDLLTTFTGNTFYPDSLIRMKYITAKWDNETIQFYLESQKGNVKKFTLEEFLQYFQGNYQLYYREEGIMGKGNIPTDIDQIKEIKSNLTPLQIDIEIQKDGEITILFDQREERWYDNTKPVKTIKISQEEINYEYRDTK